MFEPTPRWRLWLVPPQWFRTVLAFGPIEAIRIWRNPNHPFWSRRRMHDCIVARGVYRQWWGSLRQSQRSRFLFGLPRVKVRPTARIIRPPQFHPEIARIKREQEAIKEWSRRHPGRDPIECPLFQERVARVREQIAKPPPNDLPE